MTSVHFLMVNNCVADAAFALVSVLPTLLQFATAPYYYGGAVRGARRRLPHSRCVGR